MDKKVSAIADLWYMVRQSRVIQFREYRFLCKVFEAF